MKITKSQLDTIVKEEVETIISESIETIIGAIGAPWMKAASNIKGTYDLINKIKAHANQSGSGNCIKWVDRQAKKRGWNMKKLSVRQLIVYGRLYEYCRRINSEKEKEKREKWNKTRGKGSGVQIDNPYKKTVRTVRGARAGRYKKGHSAVKSLKNKPVSEVKQASNNMQKLFENWRRHINESIADDFLDTLKKSQEEREARPGRAAQAKEWEKNPPTTEEEWEEFRKWKRETEAGKHRAASPEEYEKARTARKIQKPKETLAYNCQKIKPFLRGYEWQRIGTFSCNSLEEATQGLEPGTGKLSQVFSQSRLVRTVGEGAYGVALLFDNGHIVKIFKGGIHGGGGTDPIDDLKAELRTYSKLLNSQFGGSAKSHDLSVYEYGTIPVYVPNAERNMVNPVDYIGYAEIGKVIPFESWVSDNFNEFAIQADQIKSFFSDDLYSGLSQAANRSRTRRTYGEELKSHHIKSFDQIPGGSEDYANYVTKWIENKNLENNSDWVQKYGWAGEFSDFRDINKDVDPADIPAMPEDLQSGRGAKLLKDFLVALYDIAKSNGDEYLYGKETRDVHTGNFGISYQTGEVIIFDR